MRLFLVRHGETQDNVDGIVQGWNDSKLNDNGIQQAQTAASQFDEPVVAIYSSDLRRCVETARFFKEKYPRLTYLEDKRLRERNFGDAQGTHKVLHDWEVFWSSNDQVSIPNAESLDDFTKRVDNFLEELKAKFKSDESILVITHGGTINRILEITKTRADYYPVQNCEVVEVNLA